MNESKPADVFVLRGFNGWFLSGNGSVVSDFGLARKWNLLADLAVFAEGKGYHPDLEILRYTASGDPVADPKIPATLAELLAPAQAAGTPASG